jgi:hypothetical protein
VTAALDIALDYIGRGWNPVPVDFRSKKPSAGPGWQLIRITADNAAKHFNGAKQNIGIQMGPVSGGLADGDMDTKEAIAIAPYFMPRTKCIFGRASARNSHFLYRSDLADIADVGSIMFKDPATKPEEMILELRVGGGGKGAQTVGPGSIHETTGEEIRWEENGEPAQISGADLLRCARIVASLALLARHWPAPGSKARHHTARRLGGFLARCGWNETQIELALEAVTKAANDEEQWDRKAAGRDALRYFLRGGPTCGFPTLKEDFGESIARRVAEWLDYKPEAVEQQTRDQDNVLQFRKHAAPDKAVGLEIVPASSVKMKAVKWLWQNRFAVGKVGLIAGLPDQGKSQVLCDIVARITTTTGDKNWPCKEGIAPTGNVVMFSAEDDVSDTLVPRLLAAGADLTRVFFIKMTKTETGKRMFDIDADRDQLRHAINQIGNVVAATFDPFSAYLGRGRVDTYRTSDVRAVLGPLAELAAETGVSIIGILHFNKKTDVTNAMLRISDSLAFVAASRSAYAVVADDENQRKLLVRAKNNLAPATLDKALAYYCTVESAGVGKDPDTGETITAPHVIWHPHYIDVTTTEAMQAAADNKSPGQLDDAKTFLSELLENGPVAEKLIQEAAEHEDIAKRTLRRAKKRLSIETAKERGCDPGRGSWYWRLPGRHKWPWDETKGGQFP